MARASRRVIATRFECSREAARDSHPQAWRLPQTGKDGEARRAGISPSVAQWDSLSVCPRSLEVRALAGGSAIANNGSCARESRLAGLFRRRVGFDQRGFRQAIGAALASGIARLAGRGVHGSWLEFESAPPAHRDKCNLPAIVPRDAGIGRARSLQSLAGAWAEVPGGR